MDIKSKLKEFDLNSDNAVVIGSGILNALNLRESQDIDLVVVEEKYKELAQNSHFEKKQIQGKEILDDGLFEIGTSWTVMGKIWKFEDLLNYSIVINGVRYNKIDFLLEVKRRWIVDGEGRQKDIDDVKLIEEYFRSL